MITKNVYVCNVDQDSTGDGQHVSNHDEETLEMPSLWDQDSQPTGNASSRQEWAGHWDSSGGDDEDTLDLPSMNWGDDHAKD